MARQTSAARKPLRIINCTVPIRICDIGGWTDTWFARHGRVLNIAVTPVNDQPAISSVAPRYSPCQGSIKIGL